MWNVIALVQTRTTTQRVPRAEGLQNKLMEELISVFYTVRKADVAVAWCRFKCSGQE